MEYNAKIICKTVISGKEQNLNKQMAETNNWNFPAFSVLYTHFGQIQYFFKVLKTDFTNQYCVGTRCQAKFLTYYCL